MSLYTGTFFGGINGLLYLDKEMQTAPEFYPDILLRKLTIGRTQVLQGDYYTDDGKALQFKGTEISFTLSFVVPDFYQERISNILTSWKDMTKTGPLLVVSMKLHIQECRQVIISLKYATRGMCLIRNIGISLFQCIFSLHGIVLHRLILFILSFSCCC